MKTAIFLSNPVRNKINLKDIYHAMYKDFFNIIKSVPNAAVVNEEKRIFIYKLSDKFIKMRVKIWFYHWISPAVFILSVVPLKDNLDILQVSPERLSQLFFDALGRIVSDGFQLGGFDFSSVSLQEHVDISHWFFLLRDGSTDSFRQVYVKDFWIKRSENIKNLFARNVSSSEKIVFLIPKLRKFDYSLIDIIKKIVSSSVTKNVTIEEYSPDTIKTKISSSNLRNLPLVIFMYEDMFEKYPELKQFLLENNITSQFLRMDVVKNKGYFLKNSLVLEMSQKLGRQLICLDSACVKVTNLLYLTDVDIERKLFLVSYEKIERTAVKEKVRIFPDLKTKIDDRRDLLTFEDEGIRILVDNICEVGIQSGKVDIYITRFIKFAELNDLVDSLRDKGINIRKVFFISNHAVKGAVMVSSKDIPFSFPYALLFDKIAVIRSVKKVIFYGDLLPLWCHLLYPKNSKITNEDVATIIWSIKKRTYRIDNYHSLKLPEILSIFRNPKKTYLKDLKFNQDFELSLLL